jgi:rfaE bifunctional protein kinase chain/domain
MNPERLQELIARFPDRRIAVLGDFFLDKYLEVDPTLVETSVETGKPAHQVVAVRCSPGAAGTVVNNLASLGAGALHALGAVGDDGEGYDLRRGLERLGCSTTGLISSPLLLTPTYLKPRDADDPTLAGEHSRYDTKNRQASDPAVIAEVLKALDRVLPQVDAVIICDQVEQPDHGVITKQVRDELARRARQHPNVVFFADSRKHIRLFRHVMIKPNQFEAVGHENPLPSDRIELDRLRQTIPDLCAQTGAAVFVTLGERGMLVGGAGPSNKPPQSDAENKPRLVPSVRIEGPIDTTGAGDSATAGTVLALAAGATLTEAALIGNLAASLTVQQLATTGTADRGELAARLELWRSQNPNAETFA